MEIKPVRIYRVNSNTLSPWFYLITVIYSAQHDGQISYLSFVDKKKAFNSVNKDSLLHKLERLGIKNTKLSWFKGYLSDNVQYSECGSLKSEPKAFLCIITKAFSCILYWTWSKIWTNIAGKTTSTKLLEICSLWSSDIVKIEMTRESS